MLKVEHFVNSVYSSNTYLLYEDGQSVFWLVDCGDIPPLFERLKTMCGYGFIVKGVLLTHAHYDHMYGLPQLTESFPNVLVFTNEYGRRMLANERLNFSKYHEDSIIYKTDRVISCGNGDEIDLFDSVKAKVHYTPGHNPSCITYEVDNYLFTGDSFIPGISVVTNLPGGDKKDAFLAVEAIKLWAEGKTICPGHAVLQE